MYLFTIAPNADVQASLEAGSTDRQVVTDEAESSASFLANTL